MNYDIVTQRLQAWLAPEDIIAAGAILAENKQAAFGQSALILASPWLQPEQDGGLRAMCDAYLQRFRITPDIVQIVKHFANPNFAYDWEALVDLRYQGKIIVPQRTETSPHAILEIRERSVVTDLLMQPLKGLQGMISTAAKSWSEAANTGAPKDSFYHRHRASEPFAVWLDAEVGRSYGFFNLLEPDFMSLAQGPHIRYRAVTVSNFHRSSGKLLDGVREDAVRQALSTWRSI